MTRHTRTPLLVVSLLFASAGMAQEFIPLSPSTPQLAAVKQWHSALVAGDFLAYKKSIPDAQVKSVSHSEFDEIRKWTPELVKVSVPKALPNGNFEVTGLGCKEARRQAVSIVVVKSETGWKVFSTGWAQVWGSQAKACPIE